MQDLIAHQKHLLSIYRRNLAHYRAQAKAYGGLDLAPPMTRNGMQEQIHGIQQAKCALETLGAPADDLPGDE